VSAQGKCGAHAELYHGIDLHIMRSSDGYSHRIMVTEKVQSMQSAMAASAAWKPLTPWQPPPPAKVRGLPMPYWNACTRRPPSWSAGNSNAMSLLCVSCALDATQSHHSKRFAVLPTLWHASLQCMCPRRPWRIRTMQSRASQSRTVCRPGATRSALLCCPLMCQPCMLCAATVTFM
jgi:hypothetical protein